MKIAWLCNSAMGTSETFLGDNLDILKEIGEVRAFSGNPAPDNQGRPDVTHLSFDDVPQRLHHVLRKKLSGHDVRTQSKRKRCLQQLLGPLKSFDPDIIWVEFGTTAHIASGLLEALGKPYFIAVHGFDITREFRDPWYKSEFVRLANASAGLICASHHTHNLCRTAGVNESKGHVVRLPLNGDRLKRTQPFPSDPIRFLHLGRLVEKKGPMQTLLAFHGVLGTHPKAQLTFVGEGPLRPQLEAYVRDNRLESSVTLTGALEQQQAMDLLQQQHIFCQHSVTGMDGDQEGFALSPAEAALFEMPVIATWHNGIPEHVSHEETGLLVREWDIPAMTQAMSMLASNAEMRTKLGAAGRKRILALCDPAKRKAALSTILESAMG